MEKQAFSQQLVAIAAIYTTSGLILVFALIALVYRHFLDRRDKPCGKDKRKDWSDCG